MTLAEVGRTVAQFAPMLGKLLPIPGAGIAGDLIASAFGVENTPDAIHQAITSDPNAAIKLAAIEGDNRALLQKQLLTAETARIQTVNATMQAEAKSEHWAQWGWRPFWGFASGAAFFAVAVLVCLLAYRAVIGGDPKAMAMIPSLLGNFPLLFATPAAILGVSAYHRGKQQREAVTGAQPGAIASIIGKIKS